MKIRNSQTYTILDFCVKNISCSLFQILVLICLGILQALIWFVTEAIIFYSTEDTPLTSNISLLISYLSIIAAYGVIWFVFWSRLFKDGIKWFYYRVIFSIIPLIIILFMFDPRPNPMAMINIPSEPIFSSIVTGIILLPIYSIAIYKFILQSDKHRKKNIIWIVTLMMLIGLVIFISSWNLMNIIYKL